MALSNSQLADKISALVDRWNLREDEMIDWLNGTVNGGPDSNGRYPITSGSGETIMVLSPAALEDTVDGPAGEAKDARDKAQSWANESEDTEVENGLYSALHYMEKALEAKNAAQTAESGAKTAEEDAQGHANAASTSESNAATSESNAADSEMAAQSSQDSAEAAESSAKSHRDAAQSAKSSAETAQGLAEDAQSAAEEAQSGAEEAESNAETAQSGAETAESNAESHKNAAQTAQSGAETAESNAQSHKNAAQTAESNAQGHASDASDSASAASTSESNAADSASSASSDASTAQSARNEAQNLRDDTASLLDQFGDQYLGTKTSDPSTDNDGNELVEGAVYFNTDDGLLKFYTGTEWVAPEDVATTAANNAKSYRDSAQTAESNAQSHADDASSSATSASEDASTASTAASDAQGYKNDAQTAASNASDSESAAQTAQTNAENAESSAVSAKEAAQTAESNAQGHATDAQNAADSVDSAVSDHSSNSGGVHGVPSGEEVEWKSSAQSKADTAESNAKAHADSVAASEASSAESNANSYTDTQIDNLDVAASYNDLTDVPSEFPPESHSHSYSDLPSDVATEGYADDQASSAESNAKDASVSKSGDTMSGDLGVDGELNANNGIKVEGSTEHSYAGIMAGPNADSGHLMIDPDGGNVYLCWQNTGDVRLNDAGGNTKSKGNVTAYSDRRVKKNIEPIENAVDKVSQLGGYTFERTDRDLKQTGVIAQEVREVLPEAVTGSEDTEYHVAYGNMVGLLIQAIKEQQKEIETLKEKVE